ncbi:MAG: hypothetical protein Q8O00_05505, partial [Holophaga sp.]|nr:hypothetical protein [Holophaga sp.]
SGFKAALAQRWRHRETQLSEEQIRYWLSELWIADSASLPLRGLAKLRGIWPYAGEWLNRQSSADRKTAIDALDEVLDPTVAKPALFGLLAARGGDDVSHLLAIRAHLLRAEQSQALVLVDQMLEEFRQGQALSLAWSNPEPAASDESAEDGDEGTYRAPPPPAPYADASVDRLQRWLKPFREAKVAQPVEARFRKLLKERRDAGAVPTAAWRFAFQLALPTELPSLAQDLDKAWFRGEVAPEQLGSLCEGMATVFPSEVPRWLARWPQSYGFYHARQRATILANLKQSTPAARVLFESRRRALWSTSEEIQAFDLWRKVGASSSPEAKAPATWSAALPFWGPKFDGSSPALGERLKAHPLDVLSARAMLRTPLPAGEDALFRVAVALRENIQRSNDQTLLDLKAARGLLPSSWRAARTALGSRTPEALGRILVERKMKSADINAALADLARMASKAADDTQLKAALGLLGERKAPNLKELRAELALNMPAKQEAYRIVDGRPAPIRPRDLSWSMLAQVLKAEGVR